MTRFQPVAPEEEASEGCHCTPQYGVYLKLYEAIATDAERRIERDLKRDEEFEM
jgi:hypothetical protein